jgi:hypothetical protein
MCRYRRDFSTERQPIQASTFAEAVGWANKHGADVDTEKLPPALIPHEAHVTITLTFGDIHFVACILCVVIDNVFSGTATLIVSHTGEVCAVRKPAFEVIRFEVLTIVETLLKPTVLKGRNRINLKKRKQNGSVWPCRSSGAVT